MGISAVFACVRTLVDAAVLAPLIMYKTQADGTRARVDTGRLPSLLERPAPATTGPALTSQLMLHLALWGECLLGKIRTDGVITGLEGAATRPGDDQGQRRGAAVRVFRAARPDLREPRTGGRVSRQGNVARRDPWRQPDLVVP